MKQITPLHTVYDKNWKDTQICSFISTDDLRVLPIAQQKLGDNVFRTAGQPMHSSLSKSKGTILKSLAGYFFTWIERCSYT